MQPGELPHHQAELSALQVPNLLFSVVKIQKPFLSTFCIESKTTSWKTPTGSSFRTTAGNGSALDIMQTTFALAPKYRVVVLVRKSLENALVLKYGHVVVLVRESEAALEDIQHLVTTLEIGSTSWFVFERSAPTTRSIPCFCRSTKATSQKSLAVNSSGKTASSEREVSRWP